jgi:hypothetical protein
VTGATQRAVRARARIGARRLAQPARSVDLPQLVLAERTGGLGGQALVELGAVLDAEHDGRQVRHREGVAMGEQRGGLATLRRQPPERRGGLVVARGGVAGLERAVERVGQRAGGDRADADHRDTGLHGARAHARVVWALVSAEHPHVAAEVERVGDALDPVGERVL